MERELSWRANILTDEAEIYELLSRLRRIAVLGIRSERFATRPAHYVPAALQRAGLEVIPVPVHERELGQILGQPVYHSLAEIPGPIDLVNVFRRSADIPPHVPDILAAQPKAVWFQSGIRNDAVAEQLARQGITVVQDACLMVEYNLWRRSR